MQENLILAYYPHIFKFGPRPPKIKFFKKGEWGAYWKGALIIKIFLLGGMLIGGRALIGRRALNRIIKVWA